MSVASFPKTKVDVFDVSRVKVFKWHGIFLPQNKYSQSKSLPKSAISKKNIKCSIDYRNLTLPEFQTLDKLRLNSASTAITSPTSGKWSPTSGKRSRVTWSGVDRGHNVEEEANSFRPSPSACHEEPANEIKNRTDKKVTMSSAKSAKSWPETNIKTTNRKTKMGFQWKLPLSIKREETDIKQQSPRPMSDCTHTRSKNLTPVASGLERTGMSERRLRWSAWDAKAPSDLDISRNWHNVFQRVKDPPIRKFRQFHNR